MSEKYQDHNRIQTEKIYGIGRKIIVVLLVLCFFGSVFCIYGAKNQLWDKWMPVAEEVDSFQALTEDATWKMMNEGTDPKVGNVWTTLEYDSSNWKTGVGPFVGVVSEEADTTTSFYLYEFEIGAKESYGFMEGEVTYTDAIVVYLNGEMIHVGNVLEGGYASNLDAGAGDLSEDILKEHFIVTDLDALREGKNILAVEIHAKDLGTKETYFAFDSFALLDWEYEETVVDTTGLLLQKTEGDAVELSWITPESGQYQVEYMEGTLENLEQMYFATYADTKIMGNDLLPDGVTYEKSGIMERLKTHTTYVYRVVKVGQTEGSAYYEFTTSERQNTEYLFVNDITKINAALDLSGGIDYVLLGAEDYSCGESLPVAELIEREVAYRAPLKLKAIPSIPAPSYETAVGINEKGYTIDTTMTELLISLDVEQAKYATLEAELKEVIPAYNRQWLIVTLHVENGMENLAKYLEMLERLGADVVLLNDTSETMVEYVENTYCLHVEAYPTKISASENGLIVEILDVENGMTLEAFHLQ